MINNVIPMPISTKEDDLKMKKNGKKHKIIHV